MQKYYIALAFALFCLPISVAAWIVKAETTIMPGHSVTIHCKEPVQVTNCDMLVVSPSFGDPC